MFLMIMLLCRDLLILFPAGIDTHPLRYNHLVDLTSTDPGINTKHSIETFPDIAACRITSAWTDDQLSGRECGS